LPKILFHLNSISERGTTTAALEYAEELKRLGHDVTFGFNQKDSTNNSLFIRNISNNWHLLPYLDFDVFANSGAQQFDYAYFLKSGENDGKFIPGIENYIHSVFQSYEPHGNVYAYVSEWLAKQMKVHTAVSSEKDFLWAPHIVNMPEKDANLRQKLGIPKSAIVGIRIGGYDTFDINFVRELVDELSLNANYYFIFINTEKFINRSNVIFLDTVFDKQLKANLLASCDYFLHARERGETFGVAIVEAMQMGIPVFAWHGGMDRNHVDLLPPEMLYSNANELRILVRDCKYLLTDDLRNRAENYRPELAMKKFLEIFPFR